jgi:uncharacterized protein with WD repeat
MYSKAFSLTVYHPSSRAIPHNINYSGTLIYEERKAGNRIFTIISNSYFTIKIIAKILATWKTP